MQTNSCLGKKFRGMAGKTTPVTALAEVGDRGRSGSAVRIVADGATGPWYDCVKLPAVFLSLAVVRLLSDLRFLAGLGSGLSGRDFHFDLPKQIHDLLRLVSLHWHPSFPRE